MTSKKHWFIFLFILSVNFLAMNVFAEEVSFTLEDRDRLIRIETSLKEFKESTDKRFMEFREYVDKRFEQVDKRFEQLDNRFVEFREYVDKRFEQVINFLWMLIAIFVALTSVTIGFAIWDRRTMIRPFEEKMKKVDKELDIEKEKVESLILSLRELARKDSNVSAILKQFNLL